MRACCRGSILLCSEISSLHGMDMEQGTTNVIDQHEIGLVRKLAEKRQTEKDHGELEKNNN